MYDKKSQWVFRGHWNSKLWKLRPSAWRHNSAVFARFAFEIELCKQNGFQANEIRHSNLWIETEERFLREFYQLLFDFGHPLPKLTTRATPEKWIGAAAAEEFIGLAQHHGIPTRFLNWTFDPLTASFVAVAELSRSGETEEICVWCLDTQSPWVGEGAYVSNETNCLKIIWRNSYSNPFLKAQKGLFTETIRDFPETLSNSVSEEDFPSVESVFSKAFDQLDETQKSLRSPVLRKVVLARSEVDRLLDLLEREGYRHSLLMPTLDNFALDAKSKLAKQSP